MEKNKKLIFLVCILCVLVLVLGGYIVYDKVFSEEEKCIEKNNISDDSNVSLINKNMSNYTVSELAKKYKSVNSVDGWGSYVEFSNDGTWKASKGGCEGETHLLSGTFTLENNKINLEITDGSWIPTKGELIIVSGDDGNGATLLFDKDEILVDCSYERYFVIDR